MKSFRQKFTIHPVGQGLFYSGIINIKANSQESQYKLVFDCGSLTPKSGDEEADAFRNTYLPNDNSKLDLLVISHFDADHVNKIENLLKGNRKIDKLVMPFTFFEERLFLALRYIFTKGSGFNAADEYTIRLIIDPIGTLSNNFDDGTTVYIVTSDPDSPPFDVVEGNNVENENIPQDSIVLDFDFDGEKKEFNTTEIESFKLIIPEIIIDRVKKVKDSIKANLFFKFDTSSKLIELLFHTIDIGNDKVQFYKEVYKIFCNHFTIDMHGDTEKILAQVIQSIKTIKAATLIKRFFKEAKRSFPKVKVEKRDLIDMNTTALSLLHFNMPSITSIFSDPRDERWNFHNHRVVGIKKFNATNNTRIEQSIKVYEWLYYPLFYDIYLQYLDNSGYPNTLLTSDQFLFHTHEVDQFYLRYQNYWKKFWLFQIPHHGSIKSSNKILFSKLKTGQYKIMNYGIGYQYSHPDKEVITDLISTSQSENLLAVNEFSGYSFVFHSEK